MRTAYIDAVLSVADLIPAGHVLSYGDIAVLLESGGPRQVGSVMSHYGSAVAWWRVIRAGGQPPAGHDERALASYRLEGTPLRGKTTGADASWRVDMRTARWNPAEEDFAALDAVADAMRAALAAEPGETGADGAAMSVPHDEVDS
ncbi:MGMT family protein [Arthrobacter sp. 35W]|uniref:MGMT family protein n=1 Tax=Arthrobacter sp. 35W TaxID=1132441 RepID=UPI00041B22A3|nr:MGMT family protein [Arthrobacter sp. 35W]